MSTTSLIRKAKGLNLHGAQPGTPAVIAKVITTLEEERALRLRLQREANRARAVIVQMEERAAEMRDGALDLGNPAAADLMEQEAVALDRFAEALRAALSSDGEPGA